MCGIIRPNARKLHNYFLFVVIEIPRKKIDQNVMYNLILMLFVPRETNLFRSKYQNKLRFVRNDKKL